MTIIETQPTQISDQQPNVPAVANAVTPAEGMKLDTMTPSEAEHFMSVKPESKDLGRVSLLPENVENSKNSTALPYFTVDPNKLLKK